MVSALEFRLARPISEPKHRPGSFARAWRVPLAPCALYRRRCSRSAGPQSVDARLVGLAFVFHFVSRPVRAGFNRFYARSKAGYERRPDRTLAHRGRFLSRPWSDCSPSPSGRRLSSAGTDTALLAGRIQLRVLLPEGSPLEATDETLTPHRRTRLEDAEPGVESYFTSVGTASRVGSNVKTKDENLGQLNVVMKDKGDRGAEDGSGQALRGRFDAVPRACSTSFRVPHTFPFQPRSKSTCSGTTSKSSRSSPTNWAARWVSSKVSRTSRRRSNSATPSSTYSSTVCGCPRWALAQRRLQHAKHQDQG